MRSNEWTAEEKNQLHKNERHDHFLIRKLIDSKVLKKTDAPLKFIVLRIKEFRSHRDRETTA